MEIRASAFITTPEPEACHLTFAMKREQNTALEVIRRELEYRREKQWKIFSWSATVLLAATGGIVTLADKKEFVFPCWLPVTIACALIAIAFYSFIWIYENIYYEALLRKALIIFLKQPGPPERLVAKLEDLIPDPEKLCLKKPSSKARWARFRKYLFSNARWARIRAYLFGYLMTIILLAIAAVLTALFAAKH